MGQTNGTRILVPLLPILATTLLVTGCPREFPGGGDVPANLVLITLDTTRADRLGCYGYGGAATPVLDRIAAEGALVDRTVAVAPLTLPSHASILTGLYPPRHGVRDNSDFRLPLSTVTLAEHLAARGYSTGAVVGAYVLSADFGVGQGFGTFDEPHGARAVAPGGSRLRHEEILERSADEVTDRALEMLDGELTEPFFLWVHYFDPHMEYTPPPPFAERFRDRPYDGEIAFTDEQLGRLVADLERRDLLDRTLLVVTADHGESLGEHGEDTHGLFVYDSTQRVPLLVRFPGPVPSGTRMDGAVSSVDIAPTVLDLLGLAALDGIDGVSFASALRNDAGWNRGPIYAEAQLPRRAYGWSPLFALETDREKFIAAPQPELYDLREDPGELRNLAADRAGAVASWTRRLEDLRAGWPDADPRAVRTLDPAEREKLTSLGYLSGGATAGTHADGVDPKQLVELHNRLLDVQGRIAQGDLAGATRLLESVIRADPTNPAALGLSGTLLCTAGACDDGVRLLEEASWRAPGVYQIQRNLANALHLDGRLEDAARAYRAAIDLHPFSGEDRYGLGNVLFDLGEMEPAIAAYREALEVDPESAPLLAALGVALAGHGDTASARDSLLEAVERSPGLTDAWVELGVLAERAGELTAARDRYTTALETAPTHSGALFAHARVSLRLGEIEAARDDTRQLLRHHPDDPAGRYLEAQVEASAGNPKKARKALERFLALPNADPRLTESARALLRELGG